MGSAFVRDVVAAGGSPFVFDAKTYAGDEERLREVEGQYDLVELDVASPQASQVIQDLQPEYLVHFAAETHVTRSEKEPEAFWRTNVRGTENLLRAAAQSGVELFVHISTDEVYGPCSGTPFTEDDKQLGTHQATSSYAKSKAAADDLVLGYADRLPILVIRLTNCFGPWQHPEKAIPRWITRALQKERLPVWGSGEQIRRWLYVEDASLAIQFLIDRRVSGRAYNIGPMDEERTNLEVACVFAEIAGLPEDSVYLTRYDRPRHDDRYAVDLKRITGLGWSPNWSFVDAAQETFRWYQRHRSWWQQFVPTAESLYDDAEEKEVPFAVRERSK